MIKSWWWRIQITQKRTSKIIYSQDGFGRTKERAVAFLSGAARTSAEALGEAVDEIIERPTEHDGGVRDDSIQVTIYLNPVSS